MNPCTHASAIPFAVDNHGEIYIAAGYACRADPAWCPGCGAIKLKHLSWRSPSPGAIALPPEQSAGKTGKTP